MSPNKHFPVESNMVLDTQIFKHIPEDILSALLKQHDRRANSTKHALRHHLLVLLFSHVGAADSVRYVAN